LPNVLVLQDSLIKITDLETSEMEGGGILFKNVVGLEPEFSKKEFIIN
jgi:hypothetical protein